MTDDIAKTTGYRFEGTLADRKAIRKLQEIDGDVHHVELKVTTKRGGGNE